MYKYIERASEGIKTCQEALLKKAISMKDYEHTKMIDELFTHELMTLYERRGNYEKAFLRDRSPAGRTVSRQAHLPRADRNA